VKNARQRKKTRGIDVWRRFFVLVTVRLTSPVRQEKKSFECICSFEKEIYARSGRCQVEVRRLRAASQWYGGAIVRCHDGVGPDVREFAGQTTGMQIPARPPSHLLRPQRIGGAADAEGLGAAGPMQGRALREAPS
jgi:hypothetical protein